MAFVCIERLLFTVIDTGYTDCGVKKYFHICFFVCISHTYMFQIVKETLILEKNNSIKYKTHF